MGETNETTNWPGYDAAFRRIYVLHHYQMASCTEAHKINLHCNAIGKRRRISTFLILSQFQAMQTSRWRAEWENGSAELRIERALYIALPAAPAWPSVRCADVLAIRRCCLRTCAPAQTRLPLRNRNLTRHTVMATFPTVGGSPLRTPALMALVLFAATNASRSLSSFHASMSAAASLAHCAYTAHPSGAKRNVALSAASSSRANRGFTNPYSSYFILGPA
jgi:hypothetical protein